MCVTRYLVGNFENILIIVLFSITISLTVMNEFVSSNGEIFYKVRSVELIYLFVYESPHDSNQTLRNEL